MDSSEDDPCSNIIPSSNFEPPPPVDYIMPMSKNHINTGASFTSPTIILNDSKGSVGSTGEKLSFGDGPSFLAESTLYTQNDDFDDIRQSLTESASTDNGIMTAIEISQRFDPKIPTSANLSQENHMIHASSPFQYTMRPHCYTPNSRLLIYKMLSQQEQNDEAENKLPSGPSRFSDFASPSTSGVTSADFKSGDGFSSETKMRVSAPLSALSKHAGLLESNCYHPSTSNYLTSIENMTVSLDRSSSKPNSCSDLLNTDNSDSDSFRRPNSTTVTASTKQNVSRQTLSSLSGSDCPKPAAFNFSLTLNISAIDTEASNFDFKPTQFTKAICWTCPQFEMSPDSKSLRGISAAACRLNNYLNDWLMSADKLGMQAHGHGSRLQITIPPSVVGNHERSRGLSSSSSDYFVARTMDSIIKTPSRLPPSASESSCVLSDSSETVTSKSKNQQPCENSETPTVVSGSDEQNDEQTSRFSHSKTSSQISQQKCIETGESKEQMTSFAAAKVDLLPGAQIYAQWKTDTFFYAGRITKKIKDNKVGVKFEDKSSGLFHVKDVICTSLLPTGSEVAIDELDEGEYELGYVVNGHEIKDDYSYSIRCLKSGETSILPRKLVAIGLKEVHRLVASGLISMGQEEEIGDSIVTSSSRRSSTILPFSPKTSVVKTKKFLSGVLLASPEVSLDNIVYGKRSFGKEESIPSMRKRHLREHVEGTESEVSIDSSEAETNTKEKKIDENDFTQGSMSSVKNSIIGHLSRRTLRHTPNDQIFEELNRTRRNKNIDDEKDGESTQESVASVRTRRSSRKALRQSITEKVLKCEEVVTGLVDGKKQQQRTTASTGEEGGCDTSKEDASASKRRKKIGTKNRRRSELNRRESQIWAFGRRAVASASKSRKERTVNRVRPSRPASAKPGRLTAPESPRQKLGDLTDTTATPKSVAVPEIEHLPLPTPCAYLTDVDASTQPMEVDSNRMKIERRTPSRSSRLRKSILYDVEELNHSCRKYNIPAPKRDLFTNWAIVLTSGVTQAIKPSENPSNLTSTQIEACNDRTFLTLLVTAGGGELLQTIEANRLSTTGRLLDEPSDGVSYSVTDNDGRHVALVAPAFMRTLKFLQGLATFGRVPLLRATWLLDACLNADNNPKQPVEEVPLNLLKHDRFCYELPRGIDHQFNQIVSTSAVHALYAEDSESPPLTSLLSTLSCIASIVAIVTDDTRTFGQGWTSILRLASTYENQTGARVMTVPPSILSSEEAVAWLTTWQQSSSNTDDIKQLVFIDQDRIPPAIIPRVEALGFVLINKEYLIHSLIHAKMINLKHALSWSSV